MSIFFSGMVGDLIKAALVASVGLILIKQFKCPSEEEQLEADKKAFEMEKKRKAITKISDINSESFYLGKRKKER